MKTTKKSRKNIKWEEGSQNVFTDLEMPNAEEKLAKADLAMKINEIIAHQGLRQIDAATLLHVDQAKISLLNRGRLAEFSLERLVKFLTLLSQDIDIVVKKPKKNANQRLGRMRVIYQY
ncbi:MAG: helix-turn-helix transcriptional regulator [Gammaproteobacteria bacterium]